MKLISLAVLNSGLFKPRINSHDIPEEKNPRIFRSQAHIVRHAEGNATVFMDVCKEELPREVGFGGTHVSAGHCLTTCDPPDVRQVSLHVARPILRSGDIAAMTRGQRLFVVGRFSGGLAAFLFGCLLRRFLCRAWLWSDRLRSNFFGGFLFEGALLASAFTHFVGKK